MGRWYIVGDWVVNMATAMGDLWMAFFLWEADLFLIFGYMFCIFWRGAICLAAVCIFEAWFHLLFSAGSFSQLSYGLWYFLLISRLNSVVSLVIYIHIDRFFWLLVYCLVKVVTEMVMVCWPHPGRGNKNYAAQRPCTANLARESWVCMWLFMLGLTIWAPRERSLVP